MSENFRLLWLPCQNRVPQDKGAAEKALKKNQARIFVRIASPLLPNTFCHSLPRKDDHLEENYCNQLRISDRYCWDGPYGLA